MKRKKNYFIILVLLLIVGIGIGFAVLNTTLNITGKTSITKNTWNVHFENVQIITESVDATKVPTIENNTKVDFETQLNLPGDFYEFTVDVVNDGSIDAMIESITKEPELTEDQKKYLNYTIEYQNGEQITTKQLVKANEFVRLKVRVELRKDIAASELPEVGDVLNLGFTLNYVQSDGTGSSVTDNGVKVVPTANGSLDDIGTIVTIGSERFYTIGIDGDNVKLLSAMNITLEDEPKQSSSAGTTVFASEEKHGTDYNDYEGSIVEEYINNYKNVIEKMDVSTVEVRAITAAEVHGFGCYMTGCSDSPSWLYSTTYWSSSKDSFSDVMIVYADAEAFAPGSYETTAGVRPVIVIPKSEIVVDYKAIAWGDVNEIGTIVNIGTEQFYTFGTEGDNVKLLSMYNLYVGNESYITGNPILLENPTGMQDPTARGYIDGESTYIATTPFSNNGNSYSSSIIKGYVDNYKNLLESKFGVSINGARLITMDELTGTFGCDENSIVCDKYPWIYSTSYWTGAELGNERVYIVSYSSNNNLITTDGFNNNFLYGVRPVIVISKDSFE